MDAETWSTILSNRDNENRGTQNTNDERITAQGPRIANQGDWISERRDFTKSKVPGKTKEAMHRKQLALILRYVASMHHSADGKDLGFVRECNNLEATRLLATDFLQGIDEHNEELKVLFSTSAFRNLLAMNEADAAPLFRSPPFSFYKASSSASPSSHRNRFTKGFSFSSKPSVGNEERTCWLRLTRLVPEQTPKVSRGVYDYLQNWKTQSGFETLRELLTLENIKRAPKLAPAALHRNEIKSFLRCHKKYLQRNGVRKALDPLYNCIFEWYQQQGGSDCDEELVWGLGNARMSYGPSRMAHGNKEISQSNGNVTLINGPLLEVMMEVELARDGALLLRPKEHTGVALNREVVMALASATEHSPTELLSNIHRTVANMEISHLSPGQPHSYTRILKRISVELASGGMFQTEKNFSPSNFSQANQRDGTNLIVTDQWCLFYRRKPRTVWARDASVLEEQLLQNNNPTLVLPRASLALTGGSGAFDGMNGNLNVAKRNGIFSSMKSLILGRDSTPAVDPTFRRPLFPLPTSDAQNRIAHLLLSQNYPVVVCEGPPGTGKTHTIANVLCAYLCQGKRVLITSKGAPALSVLRNRLPESVQELCVDVSTSETTGMRQLQQTVERLVDRISRVSIDIELEKCILLQQKLDELQVEVRGIDQELEEHNERKRLLLSNPQGQQLVELGLSLIESTPWLMKTVASWTIEEVKIFYEHAKSVLLEEDDSLNRVSNFSHPPSDILVSHVAAQAGKTFSYIKERTAKAVACLPILGTLSGINQSQALLAEEVDALKVDDHPPRLKVDWQLALRALKHDKDLFKFHNEVLQPLVDRGMWPIDEIYIEQQGRRKLTKTFVVNLESVLTTKQIAKKLEVSKELELSIECTLLDRRRSKVERTVQHLAEQLVEATVISKMSHTFSAEAQSALIRFSQIAGKARFSRASQPAKMTQRQKRHRQEYLEAFEKCVRYIPCWVLTSSQINDYLPPEFCLFDLVVIDEASQSDITVLPGMLRGKQWLIVGDGKQVSPTENFVSEAQINSLKAALPESPLETSLLPGHSFFDMCSQAFPTGRVVLQEHFRCAPEIIEFSNAQFYHSQLVPLRLPTSSEQMTPSLVDIRVKGTKSGKINEKECETIVKMVTELVVNSEKDCPRSIGIISLVGSEQSRLVRCRLLDAIGPQKYKEHNILVGDPPTFQGAERDIIFLSLVCSPGSVPTQNQLMHAQRTNVALSRARDRMVLVRSIDCSHISNCEDTKIPIIEFFERAQKTQKEKVAEADCGSLCNRQRRSAIFSLRHHMEALVEGRLRELGFTVRRMGVVWNDAISVENEKTGARVAICLVSAGESKQEWAGIFTQQKSIERVGWKCLRVDALSMLVDFESTFKGIQEFIASAGILSIEERINTNVNDVHNPINIEKEDGCGPINIEEEAKDDIISAEGSQSASIVVISSDDEAGALDREVSDVRPDSANSGVDVEGDTFDPSQFGDLVDLTFLRSDIANFSTLTSLGGDESSLGGSSSFQEVQEKRKRSFKGKQSNERDDAYFGDQSEADSSMVLSSGTGRRRKSRRLDKHSRDGRWYPGKSTNDDELDVHDWYDTDSDLDDAAYINDSTNGDRNH